MSQATNDLLFIIAYTLLAISGLLPLILLGYLMYKRGFAEV